jgi:ethanolaminephosphotransferase
MHSLPCISNRQWRNRGLLALITVNVLITMRLARRWNQTGQKFAGEPDIGRTFLFEHRIFFWAILCITYLWNLQSLASTGFPRFPQLVAGGIATALATAGVTFKLAFTYADSPELMMGTVKAMANNDVGLSLVVRARIIFIGILIAVQYTIVSGFSLPKRANRKSSKSST